MSNVNCSGMEVNIANCTYIELGVHKCQHIEDAGVICGPQGMMPISYRSMLQKYNFIYSYSSFV